MIVYRVIHWYQAMDADLGDLVDEAETVAVFKHEKDAIAFKKQFEYPTEICGQKRGELEVIRTMVEDKFDKDHCREAYHLWWLDGAE